MKHSSAYLTFLFLFKRSRFLQLSERYLKWIGTPEGMAEKAEVRKLSQSGSASNVIASAYVNSFWLVFGAVLLGGFAGQLLVAIDCLNGANASGVAQYLGIALLLWATFGQVGWAIQTMGGTSYPERVNEFMCRALYVVGSFFLAFSAGAAFAQSTSLSAIQ